MSSYDAELVDEAFSSWVPEFVSEHETRGCDAYCTSHYADDSEHKMLILALMAKAEHEHYDALQAKVSRESIDGLICDLDENEGWADDQVEAMQRLRDAILSDTSTEGANNG